MYTNLFRILESIFQIYIYIFTNILIITKTLTSNNYQYILIYLQTLKVHDQEFVFICNTLIIPLINPISQWRTKEAYSLKISFLSDHKIPSMVDTIVSLTLAFQEIQLKNKKKKKTSDFLVERNKLKSIITMAAHRCKDKLILPTCRFSSSTWRHRGGEGGGGWNDRSTRLFIKRDAETSEELTIRMRNHLYPTLI